MCDHERDFEIAKALKTLQENTDPQNLVSATKQNLAKAAAKYDMQILGSLAIAQVLVAAPRESLCRSLTLVTGAL
jgi:hypothetical protein